MKSRQFSRGTLIVGVLFVLLGLLWPYIVPTEMLWDNASATELTNASEALHDTMHAHEHDHDDDDFGEVDADDDPQVAAAATKYREAQARLDAAKFWSNSMPTYLRWSGLAVCAVGVAAYFVSRAG
jgi:hypothetical protein